MFRVYLPFPFLFFSVYTFSTGKTRAANAQPQSMLISNLNLFELFKTTALQSQSFFIDRNNLKTKAY